MTHWTQPAWNEFGRGFEEVAGRTPQPDKDFDSVIGIEDDPDDAYENGRKHGHRALESEKDGA